MYKFILLSLLVLFVGCAQQQSEQLNNNQNSSKGDKVKEMLSLKENEMLVAKFQTNMGNFDIELYPREVPKTVENFVGLAMKNYYNGITFHRIIDNFMIQGGDPTGTGMGGESYWGGEFADEFSPNLLHDVPGVLSMANAGPNTNGSQFFITLVPTPWLNGKHSVFGKVFQGLDVVQKIGKVRTNASDKPIESVVIQKLSIEKISK
ncbi:MAG: peptidylprolyl isomerase [Ignavibacteriales bacterium CG_4_9_14_3_um_filter_34_10]|nr:MAG: peptidylprolyl isomerase [Ignavibacteriales bacterium CG_4_9_14_3_um_filter_34_10]